MSKTPGVNDEEVAGKIHLIRNQRVMLDRDLALLYEIKPIRLREQVKRNKARFKVSQIAIPSKQHLGGHLPYAFTEHGVLMLANVLRSKRAIIMSIRIIEIFVKLRESLLTHKDLLLKLEQLERRVDSHDDGIKLIFEHLRDLVSPKHPLEGRIGFRRNNES